MSHRAFFRDIACRNAFICQSCRSSLGASAPQPWAIRHSSRVAQLGARPRSGTPKTQRSPSSAQSSQNESEPSQAAAALLKELTKKQNGEPTWRFFEKDESGQVQPLQGEDAFVDSLGGVQQMEKDLKIGFASDMKRTLSRLKDEAGLEAFGINDVESIAKEFEGQFGDSSSPEETMEKLDAYIKDLIAQLESRGFDVSEFDNSDPIATLGVIDATAQQDPSKRKKNPPIPQIPEDGWKSSQKKRIRRLNGLLSRTTKKMRRGEELTAKTVQSTWELYDTTRQTLATAWANVPHDVWDLLWQVLSRDDAHNPSRITHLSFLARDMSAAKVALSPSQQLVTMEGMFVGGWDTKAIESWKRCMPTLGDSGADTFREFWELGVRMFCQKGDLAEAERAVNKLLERQLDPRIMMPFIRSCAANPAEDVRAKAWDAYRRMKDLLGPSMGLEDYDQVISFFLATSQTERALYAFVDMMSGGTIDLTGRERLPSQIANKFFFGKWLKRLIGAGDLDGASSVFTFMRSKGIEPASIQINGLIGAWQRSGGADNFQKADDLAWDMISARIAFVRNRRLLSSIEGHARIVEVPSKAEIGAMPRATLETFSLLAENYRLRQLHDKLEELWDAFGEAEIGPNAFMMNQLIESYSQFGKIAEAREQYRTLVHERQVKPDPYTYMALWKMLGVNRLHVIADDQLASEVSITRETFAETVRFAPVFAAAGGLDGQLARKILHTFRRLKDNLGIVVTLRAFKSVFNYTPPELLALEMLMDTTNLAWDTTSARQKLRLLKRRIDGFVEGRPRQPGQPKTLDEMTPQQRGEELSEFLQTVYLQKFGVIPEGLLGRVAEEMGVYDITAKKA